jgi:hypothetical protein
MPGRVTDRVMRSAATCSMADAVGHDFVRFLSWQMNTPVTRNTDLAVQCRHPKAETLFAVVTKVHTGWLVSVDAEAFDNGRWWSWPSLTFDGALGQLSPLESSELRGRRLSPAAACNETGTGGDVRGYSGLTGGNSDGGYG